MIHIAKCAGFQETLFLIPRTTLCPHLSPSSPYRLPLLYSIQPPNYTALNIRFSPQSGQQFSRTRSSRPAAIIADPVPAGARVQENPSPDPQRHAWRQRFSVGKGTHVSTIAFKAANPSYWGRPVSLWLRAANPSYLRPTSPKSARACIPARCARTVSSTANCTIPVDSSPLIQLPGLWRKMHPHTDALRHLRKQPAYVHQWAMPYKSKGEATRTRTQSWSTTQQWTSVQHLLRP